MNNSNTKALDAVVLRYVGFGVLFGSLALLLYMVREVLPVFILAAITAYALEPVLKRMEKNGSSRAKAVGFMFVVYVLLAMVLLALLASGVQQSQALLSNSSTLNKKFITLVDSNRARLDRSKLPQNLKKSFNDAIDSNLTHMSKAISDAAPTFATATVTGVTAFIVNGIVFTLVTFGFMLEAQRIRGRILMCVPPLYRRDVTEISHSINELLGRYVRGQLIVCATYGAMCTALFEVLNRAYGMQYPLVLGAMATILYILPYIGTVVVWACAGLVAYFTASEPLLCAGLVVGVCVVINLIVDYGVAPRVLGRGVGLHPLMVIFALICGFHLGGPFGAVISVPLFAALRVIAIYLFPQLAAPLPEESADSAPAPVEPVPTMGTSRILERIVRAEGKD